MRPWHALAIGLPISAFIGMNVLCLIAIQL